jgi:hypothetical protein
MSIATTAEGQVLLLTAGILALFVIPLALWVLTLAGRIVRVLTGVDAGGWLVLAPVLAVPLGLVYASLRLDEAGEVRTAQVVDRAEQVRVEPGGDWRHDRSLTVRFGQQTAVLGDVDATTFGHTPVGASLELRTLRLADQLSLVRLPSVSTSTLVPWDLVQPAVLLIGASVIIWRLRRTRRGKGLIVVVILGAAAYPLAHADQVARERNDLDGATQHASATILDVTRVTRIDTGGRRRSDWHDVPQPYDIVQIEVRDPSYVDSRVLAVDAVDAAGAQPLIKGASVSVAYAPGSPQDARLDGRARSHYWKTTMGVYQDYALFAGGVLALLVGLSLVGRLVRTRRPSYTAGESIR